MIDPSSPSDFLQIDNQMFIFNLVVKCGMVFASLMMAFSITCGVYYLAELTEEHPRIAKKVLKYSTIFVAILYVILFIVDGSPFLPVFIGLAANGVHWLVIRQYPLIEIMSLKFAASIVSTFVNHWIWLKHFVEEDVVIQDVMLFFLIMVWLVPFGIFISLSVNENILPNTLLAPETTTGAREHKSHKVSICKRLIDIFRWKQRDVLPQTFFNDNLKKL